MTADGLGTVLTNYVYWQRAEFAFDYDVTYSFLAADEDVARELDLLLGDRLETVLRSKRQDAPKGTPTFLDQVVDSRVIVILYRPGWGETPSTRRERRAIRRRAKAVGYEWFVFIPLGSPPSLPPWVSQAAGWVDIDRWGIEGAAAMIEARVQFTGGMVTRLAELGVKSTADQGSRPEDWVPPKVPSEARDTLETLGCLALAGIILVAVVLGLGVMARFILTALGSP